MDPTAEKQALRQRMRRIVRSIPPGEAAARSLRLCERLENAPPVAVARCVLLTLAIPWEADLLPLGQRLLERGCEVCVPRVDWSARAMTPVRVASLTEGFVEGRFGVREPAEGALVEVERLDAVLVPGLAFDGAGGRLGRGAGFFDRLLGRVRRANRAWVCGAGFEAQFVDRVPVEAHDVPLDAVATEDRLLLCAEGASGSAGPEKS